MDAAVIVDSGSSNLNFNNNLFLDEFKQINLKYESHWRKKMT